jgi:hypothetical protein
MDNNSEIMLNVKRFAYMQCPYQQGYGSSLKDPQRVNICTKCGGSGLIRKRMKSLQIDNFYS